MQFATVIEIEVIECKDVIVLCVTYKGKSHIHLNIKAWIEKKLEKVLKES
ncbi:MAG: hypothetical protein RSD98_13135 [Niameybacter sp.]